MLAISRQTSIVITKKIAHRIPKKTAFQRPIKSDLPPMCKSTFSTSKQPPIQNILITNKYTYAMPQEYKGTGKLFVHGSTAEDLANIRDNGLEGRLYLGPISAYPFTSKDTETVLNAKGYALYAAQQKETPAIGVFELMQHKSTPHPPIYLDDLRGTLYFQTTKGEAALRFIAVLDHNGLPIDLPKEGYRTRREGSSSFWMSLGWYGPMLIGICAIDFLAKKL
jgi:hypothetical protein